MALSEEMRHRIYTRLQEVMGGEETAALMAQFPPLAWAEVATKTDLDHSMELVRGDIARLDGRIDQVSEVLQGRIDHSSDFLRAHIDQVSEVLRGDIARLDKVFEARLGAEVARGIAETRTGVRSLILGLVALQVSAAGLILAVSRLV